MSYREFRRTARYICHMQVLMVKWCKCGLELSQMDTLTVERFNTATDPAKAGFFVVYNF